MDTEKFSAVLKDYVSEKRKVNPRLSESRIAQNIGVSPATFYRIINQQTHPTVKTLLTLCKSIPKMKTAVTNKMLEVTEAGATSRYVGEELEELLSDSSCFITYALAVSRRGVTKKELLCAAGLSGLKALEILTKKGFIKKAEAGVYRASEARKGLILSFKIIKRQIKVLIENYRPDNTADNYIYYKTESLNRRGLKKLYETHKKTHKKVQEIMEDEKNKGDLPLFSAGFFDMFFIKNPKTEK